MAFREASAPSSSDLPVLSGISIRIDIRSMEGMIKLSDMLKVMASNDAGGKPIPFSFTVVTNNFREDTGGERRTYKGAYLLAGGNSSKNSKRNPKNWLNMTRTIQVPEKTRPITVPILLITHFNEEKTYI